MAKLPPQYRRRAYLLHKLRQEGTVIDTRLRLIYIAAGTVVTPDMKDLCRSFGFGIQTEINEYKQY